jgi:hypothetical protein
LKHPFRRVAVLAAVVALGACGTAYGVFAEIGPIYVSTTLTMQPRELPKRGGAPVTLTSITRVKTKDGSTPPTLESIQFLVDKHGKVNSKAFPTCTPAQLEGTTTAQARQRCGGALVGKGTGKALVTMPGREPFTATTAISFFNAPPSGGRPMLIAHGYETVPDAETLLVPIMIERVSAGRYGYRVRVEMPEFADGYGAPILAEAKIGAVRKRGGKKIGYINAYCSGGRLQVDGTVKFTNGDSFPATLTSPCHLPR